MPKEQSSASKEYVVVPLDVVPPEAVVEVDIVEMAFIRGRDLLNPTPPLESDWQDAVWLAPAGRRCAACVVGPAGTIELTRGDYIVWVRVFDNPEVPVIAADVLTIT